MKSFGLLLKKVEKKYTYIDIKTLYAYNYANDLKRKSNIIFCYFLVFSDQAGEICIPIRFHRALERSILDWYSLINQRGKKGLIYIFKNHILDALSNRTGNVENFVYKKLLFWSLDDIRSLKHSNIDQAGNKKTHKREKPKNENNRRR